MRRKNPEIKFSLNHSLSAISTQAKPVSGTDECYNWQNISFDWIANERCLTSPFSFIPMWDIRIIKASFQHKRVRIKNLKSKCSLNHSRSSISTQAKPVSGTDECYNWQNISFDWIANERCLTSSPPSHIPILDIGKSFLFILFLPQSEDDRWRRIILNVNSGRQHSGHEQRLSKWQLS